MAYGFNGFGGGNMNQLMRQAQKMQEELTKAKQEIEATEFKGSAGGGMVECTMNGKRELLSVKFKKEVVDPDDIEMLEDLTISAINDALNSIKKMESEKLPMGL